MSLEKGVRQTSPTVSYTKHTKNKFSSNHSSSPCPSSQKTPITSFFGRFVLCNDFCFFGLALVFRLVFSMKNSWNENQRKWDLKPPKIQEMTTGTSICPVVFEHRKYSTGKLSNYVTLNLNPAEPLTLVVTLNPS